MIKIGGNIMDDIELTRQRQEHQRKYGIQKGFPVHVITVFPNDIHVFFTHKGKEEFIKGLNCNYKEEIKHVTDVTHVCFE